MREKQGVLQQDAFDGQQQNGMRHTKFIASSAVNPHGSSAGFISMLSMGFSAMFDPSQKASVGLT
jgi:hypothetical protein